ncbi:tetraacyldisaccharide 4'-kinase [Halomonas sp. GFAJ-1]|uniref:tetraacyldisaccharide 4'-kinase n=1 Tax=Halomonas sp. GFAJ-1 TaxID=1118153 RepID=UPI00023A59C2|nr:tetraacyldisaccharide 4'-kinase [Halomonas sp. GFAJ-1]AVI63143.1 tetraacyldisaccharide 4'-kinase [Halomonas sp. GFAJ-1]EHK60590.1 tetraacyldisaccharide 4'-kinase [Halomonas sp. GFAJ-1]
MSLEQRWLKAAYGASPWLTPLYPLGGLYRYLMARREASYRDGKKPVWHAPVPVIVVGNITLGGTGKSPLVSWLARWLVNRGWSPGIVTRGYGGKAEAYPLFVTPETAPSQSGDEPLMLAQQTGLPVVADPLRARGGQALVEMGCDILLSDDGLQHLALGRDIELVVVDGARGLGNGRCLPAGPLREAPSRLAHVDAVIVNGALVKPLPISPTPMQLAPQRWRRLSDGQHRELAPLPFSLPVHAVAGIGHPERFFNTLHSLGVEGEMHPLADHQQFNSEALQFGDQRPVVMTAKDAVKCKDIAPPDSWVLEVEAVLPPSFEHWLAAKLSALIERGCTNG